MSYKKDIEELKEQLTTFLAELNVNRDEHVILQNLGVIKVEEGRIDLVTSIIDNLNCVINRNRFEIAQPKPYILSIGNIDEKIKRLREITQHIPHVCKDRHHGIYNDFWSIRNEYSNGYGTEEELCPADEPFETALEIAIVRITNEKYRYEQMMTSDAYEIVDPL